MFSVVTVLAAVTALNVLLAVLVTLRKLRRDRRERHHAARRGDLRRALAEGGDDLEDLLRHAARRPAPMTDLALVLPALVRSDGDWIIPCVRAAAERSGLATALERRLLDRRPSVRGTAALLVGLMRLPRGAEMVTPLLRDRDGDVRLVAAGALGNIASGQAAAALVAALDGRHLPGERIIERLGARWATPAILARLEAGTGPARVRSALARSLGLSGDEHGAHALIGLLDSPHLEVRVSATRALATCGGASSAASLLACLDDSAWEVRAQAAASLGALGAAEAVPDLANSLRHPAWWVRANAATALARLGDAGVSALRVAAEGIDAYAAERAREELSLAGERA